jgi:hypothetical protein
MNAHTNTSKSFQHGLGARIVRALAQLRLGTRVDFLVAGWLERCAANAVAAQHWFNGDHAPTREFGSGGEPCRIVSTLG